jgi:hypothetical protein
MTVFFNTVTISVMVETGFKPVSITAMGTQTTTIIVCSHPIIVSNLSLRRKQRHQNTNRRYRTNDIIQ